MSWDEILVLNTVLQTCAVRYMSVLKAEALAEQGSVQTVISLDI